MLNREKEGLLTDMYEGLEYQVLEDLCNEWELIMTCLSASLLSNASIVRFKRRRSLQDA